MNTPRKRASLPRHFVWSTREHRRFQDAVEKLVCAVNDLGGMLAQQRRQLDELRAAVASMPKGGDA
jgi:hypothetical protein